MTRKIREIETLRKLGDVMAIPMFLLLLAYLLYQPEHNKEMLLLRNFLLFFAIIGLFADTVFTYYFFCELCSL